MSDLFRGIGWLLVALGWFALGADAYWSWKAEGWTYQPIAFYLDLISPIWAASIRIWSFGVSMKFAGFVNAALGWPVWAPAFVLGTILMLATRPR